MTETKPNFGANSDIEQMRAALIQDGLYSRFILAILPEWRDFFLNHRERVDELEIELTAGLDERCQATIRHYICYYDLLTAEKAMGKRLSRYDMLVNKEFFMGNNEFAEMRMFEREYAAVPDQFVFPEGKKRLIDPIQFGLAYGLKFVPDENVDLRGKDVIDGGGFCGDSALAFYEYGPRKIYAFEPNPPSFDLLKRVIRLNAKESEIESVSMALADRSGILPLFSSEGEDDGAGLRVQEGKERVDVECTTIDEYVRQHGLHPGLIKLDIEGGELDALSGAIDTIRRFKPILLISIYHRAVDFFVIKPFLENLVSDYSFMIRRTSYNWLNIDLNLIAYIEK